ncbi:hypothetical protein DMC30DRAFT_91725 [Rhodotorula diobovata]|uniref:Uncharacterized protein n=1 Tax=Rhodotorula diobovata TaxID=5288 RepID=A0A5C5FNH2_9BASI|nr:hypothetical protein DMC30DRAFT_91725 [Rhodotorula diobovata]
MLVLASSSLSTVWAVAGSTPKPPIRSSRQIRRRGMAACGASAPDGRESRASDPPLCDALALLRFAHCYLVAKVRSVARKHILGGLSVEDVRCRRGPFSLRARGREPPRRSERRPSIRCSAWSGPRRRACHWWCRRRDRQGHRVWLREGPRRQVGAATRDSRQSVRRSGKASSFLMRKSTTSNLCSPPASFS